MSCLFKANPPHRPPAPISEAKTHHHSQGVSPTTLVYQSNWELAHVVLPASTRGAHNDGRRNVAAPIESAVRQAITPAKVQKECEGSDNAQGGDGRR